MNYRIHWPLGKFLADLWRGVPTMWNRPGGRDAPRFCRSDMYIIALIWALFVGGAGATIFGAIFSATGPSHHITLWDSSGFHPAFWAYLVGVFPWLICLAMETIIVAGALTRGLCGFFKMALPRIERVPVDRELLEKYERGEL